MDGKETYCLTYWFSSELKEKANCLAILILNSFGICKLATYLMSNLGVNGF